ncbi:hypothetical protein EDC04DRAFT_2893730 [Pisolithus marmoratus]|nr:hypothetical protein EDC04DRAFT_2893730 [Pisolithus marmoratus]
MFPTPLAPNPFLESELHIAYQRCLTLEAAGSDAPQHCPPPILCARLLGHLLRLAPAGNGQRHVQREITVAADDIKLMNLARFYLSHFICAFKRAGRLTPAPSEHLSHTSFEDFQQHPTVIMALDTVDHRTARAVARRRDDNCCMLTGKKDYRDGGLVWVEAAHIIPDVNNKSIREGGRKQFHSAGVWSFLSMFTNVNIAEELAGNRIHRLENVMSMQQTCHRAFNELVLWLKPVEGLGDTYHVCEARQGLKTQMNIPDVVTLSTATQYPLPHPAFLALHALCCEVSWMSGAAEYIVDVEGKMEQTNVLANEGSNADVLMKALSLVQTS